MTAFDTTEEQVDEFVAQHPERARGSSGSR